LSSKNVSAERLHELLDYNPITGLMTWRTATAKRRAGAVAGGLNDNGYRIICIDRKSYLAHRLVWLFVHHVWPEGALDHDNGIRSDNRIANLRLASPSQNAANKRRARRNTSGFKGVTRTRQGWCAQIWKDGKKTHLGYFDHPEVAHAAYMAAARRLFGIFARAG
jgi:hypothetical protein